MVIDWILRTVGALTIMVVVMALFVYFAPGDKK